MAKVYMHIIRGHPAMFQWDNREKGYGTVCITRRPVGVATLAQIRREQKISRRTRKKRGMFLLDGEYDYACIILPAPEAHRG